MLSEVVVGLVEAHGLLCVDDEVACINVVAFHDHLEDFRLVNSAFLHEADALILNGDHVVHIVI